MTDNQKDGIYPLEARWSSPIFIIAASLFCLIAFWTIAQWSDIGTFHLATGEAEVSHLLSPENILVLNGSHYGDTHNALKESVPDFTRKGTQGKVSGKDFTGRQAGPSHWENNFWPLLPFSSGMVIELQPQIGIDLVGRCKAGGFNCHMQAGAAHIQQVNDLAGRNEYISSQLPDSGTSRHLELPQSYGSENHSGIEQPFGVIGELSCVIGYLPVYLQFGVFLFASWLISFGVFNSLDSGWGIWGFLLAAIAVCLSASSLWSLWNTKSLSG